MFVSKCSSIPFTQEQDHMVYYKSSPFRLPLEVLKKPQLVGHGEKWAEEGMTYGLLMIYIVYGKHPTRILGAILLLIV